MPRPSEHRSPAFARGHVLRVLAGKPLTVASLQTRLGRWTRGDQGIFGEFEEAMFGRITGVSPLFAHVLCDLAAAGLIHAFWGPRALRIARTEPPAFKQRLR
jgi:hypothetical protein